MAETQEPLLIKRYASRRLYNSETSDYVTLEDIARFIREGRDVKIVDLKTGDDLTRQYLLQIIAEHESRGDNVLPVDMLTELVRAYTSQAQSVIPQFLAMSFEMLRDGQSKMLESLSSLPGPVGLPGLEAMQAQQKAFLNALTGNWMGTSGPAPEREPATEPAGQGEAPKPDAEDLDEIRRQVAELQARLAALK